MLFTLVKKNKALTTIRREEGGARVLVVGEKMTEELPKKPPIFKGPLRLVLMSQLIVS